MSAPIGNLERPPGSAQLHRWVDWAELICLASEDGRLSVPEINQKIRAAQSLAQVPDEADREYVDEVDPLIEASSTTGVEVEDSEGTQRDKAAGVAASEFERLAAGRADDILELAADRAFRFGDSYPFTVDEVDRLIQVRSDSPLRDTYLFLLICSMFRYSNPTDIQSLSNRFERLSEHALVRYLSPDAVVRRFGVNADFPSHYSGSLFEKISALAADFGYALLAKEEDFEFTQGDGGLDLVGWIPFWDEAEGIVTSLAQCAATPKWVEKQSTATYDQWRSRIAFPSNPLSFCFIPFDYRKAGGHWHRRLDIHGTVVFDRHRILAVLSEGFSATSAIASGTLDDMAVEALVNEVRAMDLADL